jgi:endonuclease/exonuclease/phosphatase family metal-dependent hydrolase
MQTRVLTFNIRYSEAEDGPNSWQFRRELAIQTVRDRAPDLLALQEPTGKQWDDFTSSLPGMEGIFADARDNGPYQHGVALMWNPARFEPAGKRIFWQSDTPDMPGSVSGPNDWGPRPTAVVRLRNRVTGKEFAFACTHLDTNEGCWLPSVKINAREITGFAGSLPVILAGDFNCAAGSPAWRFLTEEAGFRDAWNEAGMPDEGTTTFHEFYGIEKLPLDTPEKLKAFLEASVAGWPQFAHYPAHVIAHKNYRIDWIMVRGAWKAVGAGIDTRKNAEGRCASDHWAVEAVLEDAVI